MKPVAQAGVVIRPRSHLLLIDNPVVLLPHPDDSSSLPLRYRWKTIYLCTATQLHRPHVSQKVYIRVQLQDQCQGAHLKVQCVFFDVLLVIQIGEFAPVTLPVYVPCDAGRRTRLVRCAVRHHRIRGVVIVGQTGN